MTMRSKNTKEKGTMEFLVYKDGKTYVGVCLTLDIIEEGNDPATLMESIVEAAEGYLKVVRKLNMNDDLLNRHAPKEYWDKYRQAVIATSGRKRVRSPYHFLITPYAARSF
ncbi:MAG: hypothetical protein A3C08_00410 [Candidatus Taylorbacteria bacterium RIFCSPHIGHO2_02_FULL_47_18]|uniref:HicB-like antitoxin of toxin-antitoxin system domain-containing protein n=1 Tax=Candidatus Taylorbacteria bacterium RIFCSPLOWO2_01_FULL_48_100 TaxID=1802322 RepID=A0A1G2NCU8_9BACT|nr:MAG: hypothetical protein A2670_00125 [Candidatus Taylorbacteria bacterium RIFCSPHIGHO2_01_FULL_48_38]OHA27823.1 MAG: hypothetical protein A3C08_00410 [Candidatus Taylorbacteria bacterium RIFCSPHIGHO2_02_FULL_47_18]OHA33935.1 MAG: hypothetical protein A2938_02850 [Candidatus Taylorbacteria bacterium RIFCSPLOWO2_01_FULL_48_100]OHA40909.1 MAG: hypothetical protein A3J31_03855 [Candidatus Taylorbacteria bacterium RIFCSPLOWO2_02_FULL_48_16]OHA45080.1 MAG: hypothetical protein A3H13_02720 [Candid